MRETQEFLHGNNHQSRNSAGYIELVEPEIWGHSKFNREAQAKSQTLYVAGHSNSDTDPVAERQKREEAAVAENISDRVSTTLRLLPPHCVAVETQRTNSWVGYQIVVSVGRGSQSAKPAWNADCSP